MINGLAALTTKPRSIHGHLLDEFAAVVYLCVSQQFLGNLKNVVINFNVLFNHLLQEHECFQRNVTWLLLDQDRLSRQRISRFREKLPLNIR